MKVDIQLDPNTFDLPLDPGFVSGAALVFQRLRLRLSTTLGEKPEDPSAGLPFEEWQAMRVKPVAEIANSVREQADSTPGVLRVEDVSASVVDSAVVVFVSVVTPENESLRIFLDLFGNGSGLTGATADEIGLRYANQQSTPAPVLGYVARSSSTILAPSGAVSGARGGGSGSVS